MYRFIITIFFVFVASTEAKSQSEIDTFQFITEGDFNIECGQGGFVGIKTCAINKNETHIDIISNYDENELMVRKLIKNGKCIYTKEYEEKVSGKTVYHLDFSNFRGFDYDKVTSEISNSMHKNDKRFSGYKYVVGRLSGVKYRIDEFFDGKSFLGKEKRDFDISFVVKAADLDGAKSRVERAVEHFRQKYCSGSAF